MFTPEQRAALRYIIFKARNGNELTKRIMTHLLNESRGLTREVCLTLVADREGYSGEDIQQAASGMHSMNSTNGSTHMNELMIAMGSDMRFDYHYGDYDPSREGNPFSTAGMFPGWPIEKVAGAVEEPDLVEEGFPMRFTFWLSRKDYSSTAELVSVTSE